jgi:hypothetical protein
MALSHRHIAHCTLHIAHCTLHIAHCTLRIVRRYQHIQFCSSCLLCKAQTAQQSSNAALRIGLYDLVAMFCLIVYYNETTHQPIVVSATIGVRTFLFDFVNA